MIQTVLECVLFLACAVYGFRASNNADSLPEEARERNCGALRHRV